MKKSLSIILMSILYLFVSAGVSISLHYCGGKFKRISLSLYNTQEDCCCGGKKKSKKCCQEKTSFIKVKDIHKSTALTDTPDTSVKKVEFNLNLSNWQLPLFSTGDVSVFHKPPPLSYKSPLYLTHRVLLL